MKKPIVQKLEEVFTKYGYTTTHELDDDGSFYMISNAPHGDEAAHMIKFTPYNNKVSIAITGTNSMVFC